MKTLKPNDGERLWRLSIRLMTLKRCGVKLQPDQLEALDRVVKILKPKPESITVDQLPEGFGRTDGR